MYNFDVYELPGRNAILEPLSAKRQWATDHEYPHVYRCFPMTLANQMGYGISFPEDIVFEWDGENPVNVISGDRWVYLDRGYGTVSFNTGLIFKTDEDVSMLSYPVPNLFVDGFNIFTTLISTSFFENPWPTAGQITKLNSRITLPAKTPVSAVMPISLSQLDNSVATKKSFNGKEVNPNAGKEYQKHMRMANYVGKVTDRYRDGVNHKGEVYGNHEVKSIKLKYNRSNPTIK
jgi:hypothetical protein